MMMIIIVSILPTPAGICHPSSTTMHRTSIHMHIFATVFRKCIILFEMLVIFISVNYIHCIIHVHTVIFCVLCETANTSLMSCAVGHLDG
jgi:hypothetical protein